MGGYNLVERAITRAKIIRTSSWSILYLLRCVECFTFKSAVSSVEVDIFRCDKNQKSQNDAVSMHIGHLHTDLTCIAIHTNNLMNKWSSLIIIT